MYRTIFEALIRYIFRHIEQDDKDGLWFQNEDDAVFLYNLLYALSNTEKPTYYQTKVMPDYAIFPNRNGKLCKHNCLKNSGYVIMVIYYKVRTLLMSMHQQG